MTVQKRQRYNMKKAVLFLSTILVASLAFTSCKKSYTCECINTQGERKVESVLATNRSEAQKNCNEYGLVAHCNIK